MGNRIYKKLRKIVRRLELDGSEAEHYKRLKKIYFKLPVETRKDFLTIVQQNKNYE